MPEINTIMSCLHPLIDESTYRQLHLNQPNTFNEKKVIDTHGATRKACHF